MKCVKTEPELRCLKEKLVTESSITINKLEMVSLQKKKKTRDGCLNRHAHPGSCKFQFTGLTKLVQLQARAQI